MDCSIEFIVVNPCYKSFVNYQILRILFKPISSNIEIAAIIAIISVLWKEKKHLDQWSWQLTKTNQEDVSAFRSYPSLSSGRRSTNVVDSHRFGGFYTRFPLDWKKKPRWTTILFSSSRQLPTIWIFNPSGCSSWHNRILSQMGALQIFQIFPHGFVRRLHAKKPRRKARGGFRRTKVSKHVTWHFCFYLFGLDQLQADLVVNWEIRMSDCILDGYDCILEDLS